MEQSYGTLPANHSVGSVPAVVTEEKQTAEQEVPGSNLQIHPPSNAGNGGSRYQRIGSTTDEGGQQPTNNWKGGFSISSYMQYGLVWISTTLVFMVASFGNCAPYLMNRRSDKSALWAFDVNYMSIAAGSIYGFAIIVPLLFNLLLKYLGPSVSLVHFWCLWGYSLLIFILTSLLLIILVEFLCWLNATIAGGDSVSFVSMNLGTYMQTVELTMVAVSAFVLPMS